MVKSASGTVTPCALIIATNIATMYEMNIFSVRHIGVVFKPCFTHPFFGFSMLITFMRIGSAAVSSSIITEAATTARFIVMLKELE